MKKVRNSLTYEQTSFDFETPSGVSMTIPDQSMTVQTILKRFASGLPLSVPSNVPVYNGENDDGVDYRNLDLSEKQALREALAVEIREKQEALNRIQLEKAAAAAKKSKDDYDELIRAVSEKVLNSNSQPPK